VKRLFYILFCLVLLSCGQTDTKIPAHLLPEEKMVRILADIHTAEARIENVYIYPDTSQMIFNHQKRLILDNYQVTEEEFRETYQFYLDNLRQMDRLYEIIIDTLSVRESKVPAVSDEPQRAPRVSPGAQSY
jgi:hypothetical protein